MHFAAKLNSRDIKKCDCCWVPSCDLSASARKPVFSALTVTGFYRLRSSESSLPSQRLVGGGVGENYLPQESSTVLSKSSKLAWAPPITPVVQATSLWARLWFFPLPPSGIPTPLRGNYGKVPYTPFATRKIYPLHIPTQLILGMKISLIVRLSLLILHPDPFYSKSYNLFCPFIYSTLLKTW